MAVLLCSQTSTTPFVCSDIFNMDFRSRTEREGVISHWANRNVVIGGSVNGCQAEIGLQSGIKLKHTQWISGKIV